MADPARYRYTDTAGRRSPPLYNPARSSMPVTSGGYSSLYSGDLHAMSASHHEGLASRAPDEYRTSAIPVSTTTYAVRKEPVSRSTGVHDSTRVHRVTDDNSKRPIIVTTKHHPSSPRSGSPPRHAYRSSDDGPYYTQPASSIPRSRVTSHAPASASMDDEEYQRLKDRTHYDRLERRGGDPYRAPRPGSLYAGPNYRINTLEFDEEGYEYTKPSDLARYDLDHDQHRRPRRESLDRYYRPTVSISTDLTRPFDQADRRIRGPPPTAWGLDKINRPAAGGIYEGAGSRMPLPPQVPLAPEARPLNLLDALESPREEHRSTRPVSMYQDDRDRSGHRGHHYYDDDLTPRDTRNRDPEYYQDDSVTARGFGIRVSSDDFEDRRRPAEKHYHDGRRERREPQGRYEVREPRRRSDDDLEVVKQEYDERDHRRRHDRDYVVDGEARRDRKERRSDDDEPDSKKERLRDKVAAGLGIAAASLGVGSAVRGKDDKDHEGRSPTRRHRYEETGRRDPDEVDSRGKSSRREPLLGDEEFEIVEYPRDRERSENGTGMEPEARGSKRNSDAEASSSREHSASTDDDGKTRTRRRHRDSAFDPNDTAALAEMKARLAALKADEAARKAEQAGGDCKEVAPIRESSPERKPSPVEKRDPDADASALVPKDNEKSRDERPVRVVPPPKETEKKPIKGILKPPRPQFPEEPNPVREGVAPHKDDKTKANVPPGARWTKISRKMVNPEALKIGKERFEVRDDFVIVLRVLSKEEIQAYAAATATLRERRRREYELEMKAEGEREGDHDDDDDKKTRHRSHRRDKDDDDRRDRDREKERHRRHRHESDSEVDDGDKHDERARHGGHYRSHRD